MESGNQKVLEKIPKGEDKARLYRFLADFVRVFANPTRLQILDLLSKEPRQRPKVCFSIIVIETRTNPGTVNYQLKKLVGHGLVEKDGKGNYWITEKGRHYLKEVEKIQQMS